MKKIDTSKINRTIVILMLITIVSKCLGFFRDTVIAYFFGTSSVVDIYVLSITIPCVVFGCLDAAAVAITPIYMEKLNEGKEKADRVFNNVVSWIIVLSVAIVIILEIFACNIVSLFYDMSSGRQNFDLLTLFFRITVVTVFFNPIAQIYLSYLRCWNKSIAAQNIELLISGVQIAFIVVAGIYSNTIFLPIGYVIAQLSCMVCSYIFSTNRFSFALSKDREIRDVSKLILPTFMGNSIVQINAFINKLFASTLASGSIAALNYGNTVKNLFYAIFTAPIISIYYPRISACIVNGKKEQALNLIISIIDKLTMVILPVVAYAFVFSKEIIQLLFMRGNFDYQSLLHTNTAFKMYAIGIVAICLSEVFLRCLYAIKKIRSVIGISAANVIANIILNAILINPLGHGGLALATSISALIVLPIYIYILWQEKLVDMRRTYDCLLKNICLCIPLLIGIVFLEKTLFFPNSFLPQLAYFLFTFFVACLLYVPLMLIKIRKGEMV